MGLIIILAVAAGAWNVSAGSKTYPASAENLPPITIIQEGQERTIRLTDVYDFHGHACPGATMAFQALRYGLELLYDQEVPNTEDLVIIGRMPGGPMDLFDFVMKGNVRSQRTWTPVGMTRGMDNFTFQFLRKSTMQAVTIQLKDGLWPADWYDLRDRKKAGTLTDAEKEKHQKDRKTVISEFPDKSFSELFGRPQVYKFVAWGQVLPKEIDRHIRDMRREHRRQQKAQ